MAAREVPEHPDVARERKQHVAALAFGFALVGALVGAMMIVFAAYAQQRWGDLTMPPEVQAAIQNEFVVGYATLGIFSVLTAAAWLWYRGVSRS